MTNRLLRCLWLLVAVSIVALTLPARGEVRQPPAQKSCCANMPAHHGHCGDEPVKSQDRQCCAACVVGLSLINTSAVSFVFTRNGGERVALALVDQSPRFDRPPVPPPRA